MKQNAAMCNRYRATDVVMIRDVFGFTYIASGPPRYKTTGIGPWQPGPFVVPSGVRVGQWGIENNCRIETIATAPTFKQSWARAQRCLIQGRGRQGRFDECGKFARTSITWRPFLR